MTRSIKAISPVIGTVILLGVVIAAAFATVSWTTGITVTFMEIEELRIIKEEWGPECSYVDVTLSNRGTSTSTVSCITVNSQTATYNFSSGLETIKAGESAVVRIASDFVVGGKYSIAVTTMKGNTLPYYVEAKLLASTFRMEWGETTVDSTFKTVQLQNHYENPIIVCSPRYDTGVPRTVRLKDVSSESFMIRVHNPSESATPETSVCYWVVEEGVWESPFKMEAGKYSTSTVGENNNWRYDSKDYGQAYSGNIIVLHQVMTNDDPTWITSYVSRANSRTAPPSSADSGFRIALNGAEAVDSHGSEEIGYIILQEEIGTVNTVNWESKQTSDSVSGFGNSPPYNTPFTQSFDQPPVVVLASHQEADGADGGWGVVYAVSAAQLGLAIDEDQVNDTERNHTTETCGFIVFENTGTYVE